MSTEEAWPLYEPHKRQLASALEEPFAIRSISRASDQYLLALLLDQLHEEGGQFTEVWAVAPGGQSEFYSWNSRVPKPHHDAFVALEDLKTRIGNQSRSGRVLVWIKDYGEPISDPRLIARLATIDRILCAPSATTHHRVLISGDWETCPRSISTLAVPLELERPSDANGEHLTSYVQALLGQLKPDGIAIDKELISNVVKLIRGLDAPTLTNVLRAAVHDHERDSDGRAYPGTSLFIRSVRSRRELSLSRSTVLEVIRNDEDPAQLGGLERFKSWLRDASEVLSDVRAAKSSGVSPARAILLAGVPGCGKSLAAKVAAAALQRTLLRLDAGRLMGKYLGESESNLDEALRTAEASAPCVLLIDEFEKALAGTATGEGGGTPNRMLGRLLTWLQEHQHDILVIATVNAVERLPAELLRRGRFDSFFFFGLPTERERRDVLEVHLRKRGWLSDEGTLAWLAGERTKQFSGADLEAVVKSAVQIAWLADWMQNTPLTKEHFTAALKSFEPYGAQFKSELAQLKRELTKRGFTAASLGPNEAPPRPREPRGINRLPTALRRMMQHGQPQTYRLCFDGRSCEVLFCDDRGRASIRDPGGASTIWSVKMDGVGRRLVLRPTPPIDDVLAAPALSGIRELVLTADDGLVRVEIAFHDPAQDPSTGTITVDDQFGRSQELGEQDDTRPSDDPKSQAYDKWTAWRSLSGKPAAQVLKFTFEGKRGRVWLSAGNSRALLQMESRTEEMQGPLTRAKERTGIMGRNKTWLVSWDGTQIWVGLTLCGYFEDEKYHGQRSIST